jgi:hypothetical protein
MTDKVISPVTTKNEALRKNKFINDVVEKLQTTTRKEPYMTNALMRVGLAIEKYQAGKYTGSI